MDLDNTTYLIGASAQQQSLKVLIFQVKTLNLALSLDHVKKVMNYQPITHSGLHATGIVRVEGQDITVVDLYHRLFGEKLSDHLDHARYFILAKTRHNETFALVVSQAPMIVDLPYEQIRQLPESYRQTDTLDFASHVTMITQGDEPKMVFVVDAGLILANAGKPVKTAIA